ncbi:hypothetical protein D3C81_1251850 [compost metagenome]
MPAKPQIFTWGDKKQFDPTLTSWFTVTPGHMNVASPMVTLLSIIVPTQIIDPSPIFAVL